MRYLSLFTGIGGFELGIGSEHDCIGYSEIDKHACTIYQKHFPEHHNYGDITKISAYDLPDFDILCGGFPCQAFSIAGKRKGFEDTRGTLFFDIARILRAKRPRLLLLENVKGLLSHDGGATFATIVSTLTDLGYDLQWQVLNSKDFGVPQNRERVLIVGHLRGTPRPEVFPFGETDGATDAGHDQSNTEVACTLRSRYGNGSGSHIKQSSQPFILQKPRGKNKGGKHTISPTVSSSSFEHNHSVNAVRRLTPVECERLQGFPDGWTEGVSDSQRYKTLGNAVTVNVIRDVITRMI